ncbi:ribosome hibernation-promoting factor, HPF/YfiA family [Desulfovibrio inopinatus]|uniref:ribosome hibernation-promoting factor, HPF/YfiA family n=1 Tax=Desulfovibrio inopinatus TaxID=102109 RepID=UPI0004185835|nr:ribosome-associated translation inhibitor RaiA [Desulfovibrio inopinatus]
MNISFTFKNFEPSEQLRDYAAKRFEKLDKYVVNTDNADLQVNLGVEKTRQMADVVFTTDRTHISAYHESEDMYATLDLVHDKLEAQLRKINEKLKERRRGERLASVRTHFFSYDDDQVGKSERQIVAIDNYSPKPMSVDEAAMQLDTLKYEFLVFFNSETERINVVYRRKSGDFGLIDPGVEA